MSLADWKYRKKITIDYTKIDSDLTDFPVLVKLTSSNFDFTRAQVTGNDIRFALEDGTLLSYERERHDSVNQFAEYWVKIPSVSSIVGTIFYLYYGNSAASNGEDSINVWDSNFKVVQHLPHNWVPYSGNPILSPEGSEHLTIFGSVLKDGSIYHMYYMYLNANNKGLIGHATSSDGKSWVKDSTNNPILSPSVSGWDSDSIGASIVWKEGSTWHMLYRGVEANGKYRVGYATSSDGINWTRWNGNNCSDTTGDGCVLNTGDTGTWDEGDIEPGFGVIKVGSTYYLTYSNIGTSERKVGIATSTDLINWTKDSNNPIMIGNRFCSNIFKYGDYYYLLVSHYTSSGDYAEFELYRDANPTFYPADRTFLGTVKPTAHSGWDSHDQESPWVLTDDINRDTFNASNGELWIYYAGESGEGWNEGLIIFHNIPIALKGAARDSTSNDNNATNGGEGGPVPLDGKIDGAYEFDGVNDYLHIADSADFDPGGEMTIETWVKTSAAARSDAIAIHDLSEYKWLLYLSGDPDAIFSFYVRTASGVSYTPVSNSIKDGKFHYCVGVYNKALSSQRVKLYLDGMLSQSADGYNEDITLGDEGIHIGSYFNALTNGVDGIIDEIRYSTIARSSAWIKASYSSINDSLLNYDVVVPIGKTLKYILNGEGVYLRGGILDDGKAVCQVCFEIDGVNTDWIDRFYTGAIVKQFVKIDYSITHKYRAIVKNMAGTFYGDYITIPPLKYFYYEMRSYNVV